MNKIKYKVGDILEATEVVIAHGANSMGIMGSGVAKAIRSKYPEAYKIYKKHYDKYGWKTGEIQVVKIHNTRYVINLITQAGFGYNGHQYVSYDAIKECFKKLFVWLEENNFNNIAIPMIGGGLGGGDFKIISRIIEDLTPSNIQVVCYKL